LFLLTKDKGTGSNRHPVANDNKVGQRGLLLLVGFVFLRTEMTTGIVAACLRADRVVVGAVFVALATTSAAVVVDKYSAERVPASIVQESAATELVESPLASSPVELAAAQYGRDQYCLAEAMYYEARSEGANGEKAVAEVILQRVRSRYYPNTICGVVYEGTDRGDKLCQFSYACDGSIDAQKTANAWNRSSKLASQIMAGSVKLGGQTGRATNYHTVAVSPYWAGGMLRTRQIGSHIFYRRAPLVRASANAENALMPRSGVLSPDGTIVPYDPTQVPTSSLEIKTKIEIDGAVGDGS
jgi:hypothetical protein